MQSYEFYAKPENGVIKIPEQFKDIFITGVKVILLQEKSLKFDENEIISRKRTDLLSPVSIDTRGWKFDKEEANER